MTAVCCLQAFWVQGGTQVSNARPGPPALGRHGPPLWGDMGLLCGDTGLLCGDVGYKARQFLEMQ